MCVCVHVLVYGVVCLLASSSNPSYENYLSLLVPIADEFTARTGFGNAVALLQIKGLC